MIFSKRKKLSEVVISWFDKMDEKLHGNGDAIVRDTLGVITALDSIGYIKDPNPNPKYPHLPGGIKYEKIKITPWQDQPTEDGYWWLKDDCDDLKIVQVYWMNETLSDPAISYCGSDCDDNLIDISGKWYGPIPPPKEA